MELIDSDISRIKENHTFEPLNARILTKELL